MVQSVVAMPLQPNEPSVPRVPAKPLLIRTATPNPKPYPEPPRSPRSLPSNKYERSYHAASGPRAHGPETRWRKHPRPDPSAARAGWFQRAFPLPYREAGRAATLGVVPGLIEPRFRLPEFALRAETAALAFARFSEFSHF